LRASEQALAVYNKAEERFNKGTATKVDEVLLALWDETKEQAQRLREMTAKIAMLESKDSVTISASSEYASIMQRITANTGKITN
jgi:acyl-CoA reductase-like NAD-dependent aldehyde dehydrogenase